MKEISDLRIQHLKHDDCIRYKDTLISFYYRNSVTCSSLSHFSKADAEAKINSMMDHISDGSAIVFGAITGDKLVGYIWSYEYTFREEARIYVSEIHVDESYRNRGIGKQLLRAVETAARDGGGMEHCTFIQREAIRMLSSYMRRKDTLLNVSN